MAEKIAVRAIITGQENKIFLAKRARGYGAGQWALPGGKPHQNESLKKTTEREVEEETGNRLKIREFFLFTKDTSFDQINPWLVYFFIGTVTGSLNLKIDEHIEAGWFNKNQLIDLDIAFNHREVLTQFFDSNELSIDL